MKERKKDRQKERRIKKHKERMKQIRGHALTKVIEYKP